MLLRMTSISFIFLSSSLPSPFCNYDFLLPHYEVGVKQNALKPYLMDLTKNIEYHPLLAEPAEIVSDITEGVGAKRKLTFKDGTSFFETVNTTTGTDSVWYELSEYPYPCEMLFAENSTVEVSDHISIFTVAFEFKLKEGVTPEEVVAFREQISGLVEDMVNKLKELLNPCQSKLMFFKLADKACDLVEDAFD